MAVSINNPEANMIFFSGLNLTNTKSRVDKTDQRTSAKNLIFREELSRSPGAVISNIKSLSRTITIAGELSVPQPLINSKSLYDIIVDYDRDLNRTERQMRFMRYYKTVNVFDDYSLFAGVANIENLADNVEEYQIDASSVQFDINPNQSYVLNGDFSEFTGTIDDSTSDVIANWNKTEGTGSIVEVVTGLTGNAVKMTKTTNSSYITQDIPLLENTEYVISMNMKSDGTGTFRAQLIAQDGSNEYLQDDGVSWGASNTLGDLEGTTSDSQFIRRNMRFTTKAGYTGNYRLLLTNYTNNSAVFVEDVRIQRIDETQFFTVYDNDFTIVDDQENVEKALTQIEATCVPYASGTFADGSVIVFYVGTSSDFYFKIYNADGTVKVSEKLLDEAGLYQDDVGLAFDGNNSVYVFWCSYSATSKPYFAKIGSSGSITIPKTNLATMESDGETGGFTKHQVYDSTSGLLYVASAYSDKIYEIDPADGSDTEIYDEGTGTYPILDIGQLSNGNLVLYSRVTPGAGNILSGAITILNRNIQTLFEDDFSSGSIDDSKWDDQSSGNASIVSGEINFDTTLSAGYYYVDSDDTFDMTRKNLSVKVSDEGDTSITGYEAYPIVLVEDSDNEVSFLIDGSGNLNARKKVGGSGSTGASTTYNNTTHKYLRIRELEGTTYWEYSADNVSWTELHSESNPITMTDMTVRMIVGTWQVEASTTTCKLDDIAVKENFVSNLKTIFTVTEFETGSGTYGIHPTMIINSLDQIWTIYGDTISSSDRDFYFKVFDPSDLSTVIDATKVDDNTWTWNFSTAFVDDLDNVFIAHSHSTGSPSYIDSARVDAFKPDGTNFIDDLDLGSDVSSRRALITGRTVPITSFTAIMIAEGYDTVDLTTEAMTGAIMIPILLKFAENISAIQIRLGSDEDNYYQMTVTSAFDGSAFWNGWNLLAFDWSQASTTGTPDPSDLDYLRVGLTLSDQDFSITGNQINAIFWNDENQTRNYKANREDFQKSDEHDQITYTPFKLAMFCEEGIGFGTFNETLIQDLEMSGDAVTQLVEFEGSFKPLPLITIDIVDSSGLGAVRVDNLTTGQYIKVQYDAEGNEISWADNDTVTIDLENQSVQLNGTEVRFQGALIDFELGYNNVQLSGSTAGASSDEYTTYNSSLDPSGEGSSPKLYAVSFTPGSSGRLTNFQVHGYRQDESYTNDGFEWFLMGDNSDEPDEANIIASGTVNIDTISAWYSFAINAIVTASTKYWLAIKARNYWNPDFGLYIISNFKWSYDSGAGNASSTSKKSTTAGTPPTELTWALQTYDLTYKYDIEGTPSYNVQMDLQYKKKYL